MRTRRTERGEKSERKGGKLERSNEGGRASGRGLLFYSCLEDMAHMRLPNPTGNVELKGKGKTNKGNGVGVAG